MGNYAKAAELYRVALAKPGVDADVANLHLGMALARAGDKAGATAALQRGQRARVPRSPNSGWSTSTASLTRQSTGGAGLPAPFRR